MVSFDALACSKYIHPLMCSRPSQYPIILFIHIFATEHAVSTASRGLEGITYIQSQSLGAVRLLISEHTDQTLTALEQTSLQTDDDELHPRTSMFADVVLDLLHVGVIERGVNLIKHEKGARMVGVHGE